jgi:hypothetical protein
VLLLYYSFFLVSKTVFVRLKKLYKKIVRLERERIRLLEKGKEKEREKEKEEKKEKGEEGRKENMMAIKKEEEKEKGTAMYSLQPTPSLRISPSTTGSQTACQTQTQMTPTWTRKQTCTRTRSTTETTITSRLARLDELLCRLRWECACMNESLLMHGQGFERPDVKLDSKFWVCVCVEGMGRVCGWEGECFDAACYT